MNNPTVFRKIGTNETINLEFIKSKLAIEIGIESGLFYVPKIINFDKSNCILEFEYISGLKTLNEIMDEDDTFLNNIFKRLGKSLAVIHEKLLLPNRYKKNLPVKWINNQTNNVFLHGDLTIDNVCVHPDKQKIVIVDWSTAPILENGMTFGSRYFDINWFVTSLFSSKPMNFSYKSLKTLSDDFTNGYWDTYNKPDSNHNYLEPTKLIAKNHLFSRIKERRWLKKLPFLIRMSFRYIRLNKYFSQYAPRNRGL